MPYVTELAPEGMHMAVVYDDQNVEISRRSFSTREEAEAWGFWCLMKTKAVSPVRRLSLAWGRLRAAVQKRRTKTRFRRDDVI